MSSPTPESIRQALAVVLASPGFENSDRMARFLRYVVEKSLAGESDSVKEYSLGTEVFDRPPTFDSKTDTIVRVEARRLRKKLQEYYEGPGAADPVRIDIPTPGYTPAFTVRDHPIAEPQPEPAPVRKPLALIAALAAALVAAGAAWWITHPKSSSLTSVAVLPFNNMSGDPAQEYFSDGFTEELIDRLTSIPDLRVAARTSAFEFKNKPQDIREIGRRLNVDAVVEGSIRRAGATVRITAQLIRTSDGYHIWSKSWDRQGQDVLVMETDVASAVAESFRQTLKPTKPSTASLEAHDLYLLGRHHWYTMDPGEMFKSIEYFERSIAIAPDYALAYGGLSEAYSYLIDMDIMPTRDAAGKARAAAQKALSIDETLAEAHTSLGLALMEGDWDMAGGQREFLRAVELKPTFAYGVHWLAHYYENSGKVEEGCAAMRKASQIDPLSRMYQLDIGMCLYKKRQFDQALAQLAKARELDPKWPIFDITEAMMDAGKKDWPRALEAARRAQATLGPIPFVLAMEAISEAGAGNQNGAKAHLAQLKQEAKKGYVPAFAFALASYASGEPAAGYTWLRRAFDEHNGALMWLGASPMFDIARQDPHAADLLKHVGDRSYKP